MMKILVVENDRYVARKLETLLSSYNYAVDIANNGETGLQMAEAFDYDLTILDVTLPKIDGISLCQKLRSNCFQMPILLLTEQDGRHQKVIALNAGADDYIVKSFDREELIARILTLLRQSGPMTQTILEWGKLQLEPSSHTASYCTYQLNLTPKEYAILELFLRNNQKVFSAKAILDRVWNSVETPGEESVRGHIKELRFKLKAVGAPKDLITTVYRVGYRLNPLYSSFLASDPDEELTPLQIAQLRTLNQELKITLEELQVAKEELRQQNEELEIARQSIELSRDRLEKQLAECNAELSQANIQLQQLVQQWQVFFNYAPEAIAIFDDQGCFVDANLAACQLYGVSRENLLGTSVANFLDPQPNAHRLRPQFFQPGEFDLYRPDGTNCQIEYIPFARASFIRDRHCFILRESGDCQCRKTSQKG